MVRSTATPCVPNHKANVFHLAFAYTESTSDVQTSVQLRSPDGAQRNPGFTQRVPGFAALHPGYGDSIFKQQPFADTASRSRDLIRPSFAINSRPPVRGRREYRAFDAPAALCAMIVRAHKCSHHGHTGFTRHSPRNGFNGFLRALPGDRACLPPSSAKVSFRELDTSVGVSGPHVFAVRITRHSSKAHSRPPHPAPRP
jgi:hypothetical protein